MEAAIFAAAVSAVLGGGVWQAISNMRKAPAEAGDIAAGTLTKVIQEQRDFYQGVIAEVQSELSRKDVQIAEQNRLIGELNSTVTGLRERVITLERNGNGHTTP